MKDWPGLFAVRAGDGAAGNASLPAAGARAGNTLLPVGGAGASPVEELKVDA